MSRVVFRKKEMKSNFNFRETTVPLSKGFEISCFQISIPTVFTVRYATEEA